MTEDYSQTLKAKRVFLARLFKWYNYNHNIFKVEKKEGI